MAAEKPIVSFLYLKLSVVLEKTQKKLLRVNDRWTSYLMNSDGEHASGKTAKKLPLRT